MADGTITFSTALDNEQLEKGIKQAEREVKDLEQKTSKWEGEKSAIEKQMDAAEAAIHETEAEIDRLNAKLAQTPESLGSADEYMRSQREVRAYEEQIAAANDKLKQQTTDIDKLNGQWQRADAKATDYAARLDSAKQRAAGLGQQLSTTAGKGAADTSAALAASESRFDKFAKRVNTMTKKVFIFSVILAGLRSVKGYLADVTQENDRFAASFATLMATFKGFAAPLVNAITYALTGLMNIFSKMITTLAGLIDSVFRTDLVGSIQAARAAAQAAEREAKAKKKTAKAAKEAAKSVMAFDEINAMQADKSADSAADQDQGEAPLDFDGLGAGQIDDALSAIMVILGAALMAVGAILAFSGINIPLGITLMAIGALMVYTALQENWNQLPAELRGAITTAIVITGIVLLVLGAILALSGVATPIGVGMMAAGAVLLWTAVGINWGSMAPEMQTIVLTLMAILGAALLVIGAVLAFSGAGTALGLGLMLVGAASVASAAAIAWGSLPKEMRSTIAIISALVGAALLVLGAVLAFSGAAIPLGIGLLIAGATLLATSAALSWDAIPDEVRGVVTVIMSIVGAALVVIGVVLLFTGAGIPLGLGCILAGGAMLAGAVAFNWNYIPDMISSVWNSVVQFWNQNIAPIFTFQFWENLWKSLVNGLIWAVNSGLNYFGGFINNITSGISGLLSAFGVDWSWNIRMPQIPYLAQGAVIPPNRKFAAVLGDQKSGNNLEAPESLIRQIVREETGGEGMAWAVQQGVAAALLQALPNLKGGSDGDVTMVLQVGYEELARATEKGRASLLWKGELKPEISFA